jgi:impB/mucB/samB family C-terminal domain
MTVGGSIASLGSPEPPTVVFPKARHLDYTLSTIQEALVEPQTEAAAVAEGVGWHVAPKSGMPQDRMLKDLNRVPKATLRTVFGKVMGRRIWEQVRRSNEPTQRADVGNSARTGSKPVGSELTDADLVVAMIESVSRRAGQTLRVNKREAKAIGLMLTYADGAVTSESARLARPSADASEISAVAIALFRSCRAREAALVSINLTTATLQTEAAFDRAADPHCALAPSHA